MNRLIITISTITAVFIAFFGTLRAGWLVLPGQTPGMPYGSNGATDGIVVLSVLAFLIMLIPLLFHFHILRMAKKNGHKPEELKSE